MFLKILNFIKNTFNETALNVLFVILFFITLLSHIRLVEYLKAQQNFLAQQVIFNENIIKQNESILQNIQLLNLQLNKNSVNEILVENPIISTTITEVNHNGYFNSFISSALFIGFIIIFLNSRGGGYGGSQGGVGIIHDLPDLNTTLTSLNNTITTVGVNLIEKQSEIVDLILEKNLTTDEAITSSSSEFIKKISNLSTKIEFSHKTLVEAISLLVDKNHENFQIMGNFLTFLNEELQALGKTTASIMRIDQQILKDISTGNQDLLRGVAKSVNLTKDVAQSQINISDFVCQQLGKSDQILEIITAKDVPVINPIISPVSSPVITTKLELLNFLEQLPKSSPDATNESVTELAKIISDISTSL